LDQGATAVAVARGVRVVGPNDGPQGALRAPTEVHIALTDRCPVRCDGCYLDAAPDRGHANPVNVERRLEEAAAAGVFEVAFGGGEVSLVPELVRWCRLARALGMVPNLTTSGLGLTPALLEALAPWVGQVNVSWDGPREVYRRVRGWDGASTGIEAIRRLVRAGVRVGVNTVLVQHNVDELLGMGQTLDGLGVREWQWLRYKPAGRGVDAYAEVALTADQARSLWPMALHIESAWGLTLRFDCAMTPWLVAHQPSPSLARSLGVVGCSGGRELLTVDADGGVRPCSFARWISSDLPIQVAWSTHSALREWRHRAADPPEPCGSCAWSDVCRGGCRVISRHLVGDPLAPDPECPRVMAMSGADSPADLCQRRDHATS